MKNKNSSGKKCVRINQTRETPLGKRWSTRGRERERERKKEKERHAKGDAPPIILRSRPIVSRRGREKSEGIIWLQNFGRYFSLASILSQFRLINKKGVYEEYRYVNARRGKNGDGLSEEEM